MVCLAYVGGLLAFAFFMFETRQELILLYLPFTFAVLSLKEKGRLYAWPAKEGNRLLSLVVVALLIVIAVYFRSQYASMLYERMGQYLPLDYWFSLVLILLTLFLTGALYGRILPALTLFALFYAYFGFLFPGFLYHKGLSITRVIEISAADFTAGDGVLGQLPQISITWIAVFTIFAGLAFGFNALDYIVQITFSMFRRFRYGVPQIAVVASLVFGMFSGSGAANVAGTGSFTIPLMKRYGIPPFIAGAIESVASSGGQVMPPVMGAAAFVMASYLGMYYWQIALIGFLPAIIFYGCVALAVYLYSRQYLSIGLGAASPAVISTEGPKLSLLDGLPLFAAILVLVLLMGFFWLDVMLAGFFMIVVYLATWILWQAVHMEHKGELFRVFGRSFFRGIVTGAETTASITVMMACIGIIVAVLVQTGLAQKLSFAIVEIAGENREILILLVGGLCILFGMVATTVASYILTVTLAAPILLDMGIPLLVTHFAVFYFAMVGLITPPVAPCCAVASGIANAGFMRICWYSLKIGIALVLLPFIFFYHPAIIVLGSGTIKDFFAISLGMAGLILGINLHSSDWKGHLKRLLYIGVAVMAVFPRPVSEYIGMTFCAVFLGWELYRLNRKPSPTARSQIYPAKPSP
jgi:TRAP transporter 4TM/12TM fusion protein